MEGLQSLFSDASLARFQRRTRPEEFDSRQRDASLVDAADDDEGKPKKKRKRNADAEAASAIAEVPIAAEIPIAEGVQTGRDECTLFVGNLPTDQTVKSISALLRQYGEVEAVRLRSVPVAGTAVDEKGNQNKVRMVCTNKRQFGDQKGSFNAYVVFKEQASVQAALAANNQLVGKRHIRCDRIPPSLFDPRMSVFVGGLPSYTDEVGPPPLPPPLLLLASK